MRAVKVLPTATYLRIDLRLDLVDLFATPCPRPDSCIGGSWLTFLPSLSITGGTPQTQSAVLVNGCNGSWPHLSFL